MMISKHFFRIVQIKLNKSELLFKESKAIDVKIIGANARKFSVKLMILIL